MATIEKLFLNALHDLAVGYEMVQLMHAATIGFFLMMLSMLIVVSRMVIMHGSDLRGQTTVR